MKVFNTILITLLLSFALQVDAANVLAESVEYMRGLVVGKKNIITVDLPDLPLREAPINKDEKDRAEDCLRRAFRCEEEGSAAKIREAINLFHDAAQYGQPEACAAMEVFCKEGWYGLTPGRAAAYYDRLRFWRSDIERVPAAVGAGDALAPVPVGRAMSAPSRPLVPLSPSLTRERSSSAEADKAKEKEGLLSRKSRAAEDASVGAAAAATPEDHSKDKHS